MSVDLFRRYIDIVAEAAGSVTVDMPNIQAQQDASMANHYQQHIEDYALMSDPDFVAWIETAKQSLLADPSDENAKKWSADQVKRFGSKLIGQIQPNRAGYRDAYYTPQVKNILDNDVALMYEIQRRQRQNYEEFMDNIEVWRKNWNKASDKDKEKLANMTGQTVEELEEIIARGSLSNLDTGKPGELAENKKSLADYIAENQREFVPPVFDVVKFDKEK